VAATFNLTLIPLYRIKGQEWPQLPGLLAALPPKRAARGRENDALVLYLTLAGNASLSSSDYNQISAQMAQRFYQSPGALTSALRAAAESLNQYLWERNTRGDSQGKYLRGRLVLGVLREGVFTLAQSGPTRVFHISGSGTRLIHDAAISGEGLGISPTAQLYLAQAEVRTGDRLILCTHGPAGWESGLPEQGAASLEAQRRDLLAATGDDLNSVLLEIQAGKGDVTVLRGDRPVPDRAPAASVPAPSAVERPAPSAAPKPAPAATTNAGAPRVTVQPRTPAVTTNPAAAPDEKTATRLDLAQPGRFVRPLGTRPAPAAAAPAAAGAGRRAEPAPQPEPAPKQKGRFVAPRPQADLPVIARAGSGQGISLGLAKSLRGIRLFFGKVSAGFKTLLPRLLPTLQDDEAPRSGSAMLLVAIAVPLVVVTAAVIVYTQFGQPSQYEDNFSKALTAAEGAVGQSDPATLRHAWESTLDFLDKAEQYGSTPESQALRQQAQAGLDGLDGIVRLDFRPAIYGGLGQSVQVTGMAATGNDLYLLDSTSGSILRAFLTSQGYETDPTFKCRPGTYEGQTVGALIDLAAMPGGNTQDAAIVALDAGGTLLYCAPGMDPQASPLTVPGLGWEKILGFTLSADGKALFALDSKAVWIYGYDDEQKTFIAPIAFFGEQVPQNMNQAIDLAANGSDLFLLFSDGHVTVCTFSGLVVSNTTCRDPAQFVDARAGRQSGTSITGAVFSQTAFDAPYNTSLYLLEPNTHAVYKINPHPTSLELDGQFHASVKTEKETFRVTAASALAIGTDRTLFLCIGNQVYFAAMP
jgi:hypothetical protein